MKQPPRIEDVHLFWFGEGEPFDNVKKWWNKEEAFDNEVREKFSARIKDALEGRLEDWKKTPKGTLAFIILLDQFSRNAFRGTPDAFAGDALALETVRQGFSSGLDYKLDFVERYFFYMPLMHAEDLKTQDLSVQKFGVLAEAAPRALKSNFEAALDYAKKHRDIIAQFSRFPHRNPILNRASTPLEVEFLKTAGSSF